MAYVTQDYYLNDFHGEQVQDDEFQSLAERAAEIIEELCMYRIKESKMESYSQDIQERIKKAICAQIEYLDANGGSDMDNGADIQSAGLGKFNYTKASGTAGNQAQSIYAPRARRILAPAGLLYRGGRCL